MLPSIAFLLKFKMLILDVIKLGGIVPESWFPSRFNVPKTDILPIDSGIGPVKRFRESKALLSIRSFPKFLGIVPEIMLFRRSRCFKDDRFAKDLGILPAALKASKAALSDGGQAVTGIMVVSDMDAMINHMMAALKASKAALSDGGQAVTGIIVVSDMDAMINHMMRVEVICILAGQIVRFAAMAASPSSLAADPVRGVVDWRVTVSRLVVKGYSCKLATLSDAADYFVATVDGVCQQLVNQVQVTSLRRSYICRDEGDQSISIDEHEAMPVNDEDALMKADAN
nr:hypothetical protein [Tanacetum cinerariifolium]